MTGRILINKSIGAGQTLTFLNIEELPASNYVILLEGKTENASKTIIKK